MGQEKTRKEISDKYKWDLTKIYSNVDEFNKDYNLVLNLIKTYIKWENKTISSATNLYNSMSDYYNITRKLDKLYSYASMLNDSDTSNNFNQELKNRVVNLYDELSKNTFFIDTELLKLDYSEIEKFYEEEPRLKEYEVLIKDSFRYKSHKLSDVEEKLLSKMGKSFGNDYECYSYLVDSDMTFGSIKDDNNKNVLLTDTNYSIYIKSSNRRVRMDAFRKLYKYYKQFRNTITSMFDGNIKQSVVNANIRNYSSAFSKSLFKDDMDPKVYDVLVDTVHDNLNILYKYYDLRKRVLNLDELHLYDVYTPLIDKYDKKYSFDDAKKLVLNALSVLGDDYISNLKHAFSDKWIDIYPNKAKRGGAYSGGSYDTYPYVLLNYQGQLNDVSTIAHELGHSMHSFYTRKNNCYQYGDYPIFVAEVASTVNELLLFKYMLKNSKSKEEKLCILNQLMDLFKSTIYRQTMFSEFEKYSYDIIEKNDVITADKLCNKYYELNKLYFGSNVFIDEEIKYEWEKVPHFFYDFYVYKYATGLSAACKIVNDILNGDCNNYLNMLKSGSRQNALDTLKIAGVDMKDKNVYLNAIKIFDEVINEFSELIKKK